MALIADPRRASAPGRKYLDGRWFEVSALPALAYDHQQMAEYALGRLKAKLEYTNIACNLLPETFTFAELEALYGMILKRPIDRRNFRRRILSMGILRGLTAKRRGAHRPAALYSFARREPQVVEML
jgi:8-oxo-dGTP diphosphatase